MVLSSHNLQMAAAVDITLKMTIEVAAILKIWVFHRTTPLQDKAHILMLEIWEDKAAQEVHKVQWEAVQVAQA